MQLDMLPTEAPKQTASPASAQNRTFTPKPDMTTSLPQDEPERDDHAKAPGAFKTISEAADMLDVPQHVLRFWESRFSQIKPLKMRGGRRYYRPQDMEILTKIKNLLYKQGYTIKGARKAFGARNQPVLEPEVQTPPQEQPRELDNKQQNQLLVIRQELVGLREQLKAYL